MGLHYQLGGTLAARRLLQAVVERDSPSSGVFFCGCLGLRVQGLGCRVEG